METRLLKKQMTAAYQYSYTRVALNYVSLYETIYDQEAGDGQNIDLAGGYGAASETCISIINDLNAAIEGWHSGNDVTEVLKKLRSRVTHEVEVVTAYTDAFQIYEYVLNRLERRFKTLPLSGYNDETFASMVTAFISGSKESSLMNSRIQEVVSQLPIRLTKQKFFSLVMEGLSVYIGSPKESLDGIMYTLRTESMVDFPEDMAKSRRSLYETLEQFRRIDFKNIVKEVYEESCAKLDAAAMTLSAESMRYILIQEIINDLYVLSLSKREAVIDVKEEELYRSILLDVLDCFRKEDDTAAFNGRFDEQLEQLEGRQETYYERYLRIDLPEATAELAGDPDYIRALNVDRLLSGSSFADLFDHVETPSPDEEPADGSGGQETVDRACLEKTAGAFIKDLEEVFAGKSRPVIRAIMAKILSDLPVFFNSIDEIKAYINGSLESCNDEAEKETCKELLEELMNYEDNLV